MKNTFRLEKPGANHHQMPQGKRKEKTQKLTNMNNQITIRLEKKK